MGNKSKSADSVLSLQVVRCDWASKDINIPYHDEEWGIPVHDERTWFEFLTLEGAQAGLSWDIDLAEKKSLSRALRGF